MSSGEPTDVTISMRVHGAVTKLGRLVLGPTGQLVIAPLEVPTDQDSTIKLGSTSLSEEQELTLRLLRTSSSSRESLWEVTDSKEYGHVMADFLKAATMEQAITVLVRQFERSGSQDRDIRRRTALRQPLHGRV